MMADGVRGEWGSFVLDGAAASGDVRESFLAAEVETRTHPQPLQVHGTTTEQMYRGAIFRCKNPIIPAECIYESLDVLLKSA